MSAFESVIADDRRSPLSHEEIARYSRQILLEEVGLEGQERLKASGVLIVGTGGLGAPAALYLAGAGVGKIGIVDYDFVEVSNLQRQIIHTTKDVDRPKVVSAREKIKALNPSVQVVEYNTTLTSENALAIIAEYDVVIDGTDNFQTRYLINDACVFLDKPNIYGSVYQFEGQASVFYASKGPCYRCLYPAPPPPGLVPSCAEGGVLGVTPGLVGLIQASEAIKLIAGGSQPLIGRLLLCDAWSMRFRELRIAKEPECPVCGKNPTIRQLIDYEQFCGLKTTEEPVETITPLQLKARLDSGEKIQIIDIREPHERAISQIPGSRSMPLGQIQRRAGEFDNEIDTVFACKIGNRSEYAARALRRAGHTGRILNLKDGVNGWARDVDPSLAQY